MRISAHGVDIILSNAKLLWRLLFVIVFLVALIICIFKVYDNVEDYRNSPTVIRNELLDGPVMFPAVTICNVNPYKRSELLKWSSGAGAIEEAYTRMTEEAAANGRTVSDSQGQDDVECPNGWIRNGSYCYMAPGRAASYSEAAAFCTSENASARLPIFQNQCEMNDYAKALRLPTRPRYWQNGRYDTDLGKVVFTCQGSCPTPYLNLCRPDWAARPNLCYHNHIDRINVCAHAVPCSDRDMVVCQMVISSKVQTCGPPPEPPTDEVVRVMNVIKSIISSSNSCSLASTEANNYESSTKSPGNATEKCDYAATLSDIASINAAFQEAVPFLIEEILAAFNSTSYEERQQQLMSMGYKEDDMIDACKFNWNQDCSWTPMLDPALGNCFTFNADSSRYVQHPGMRNGLVADLLISEDDYPSYMEYLQFKVSIHPPDSPASPRYRGFGLPPNYEAFYSVSLVVTELLKSRGLCADTMLDVQLGAYNESYSEKTCEFSMIQKSLLSSCGCVKPSYPVSEELKGAPFCLPGDIKCTTEIEDGGWNTSETCKAKCTFSNYNVIATHVPRIVQKSSAEDVNTMQRRSRIYVYYESSQFKVEKEVQLRTLTSLISDIGGDFGLCIGVSVISAVELLLFLPIYMLVKKCNSATPAS